jgi:hypothetical protein
MTEGPVGKNPGSPRSKDGAVVAARPLVVVGIFTEKRVLAKGTRIASKNEETKGMKETKKASSYLPDLRVLLPRALGNPRVIRRPLLPALVGTPINNTFASAPSRLVYRATSIWLSKTTMMQSRLLCL